MATPAGSDKKQDHVPSSNIERLDESHQVKSAVITLAKAYRRPVRTNTWRRSLNKGRALSPKLASLRRMALRARTAHSRATACNFKSLEATFNSYFLNFWKVRSICHILGFFPRDVINMGIFLDRFFRLPLLTYGLCDGTCVSQALPLQQHPCRPGRIGTRVFQAGLAGKGAKLGLLDR